jgi:hypothetical protein
MSWVKDTLSALCQGQSVSVRPQGGSMRGLIESGQLVTLAPVKLSDIAVGDVVFVRWKGNYLLHLVKDIQDHRYLIGNNVGKLNGWVTDTDILAKATFGES